MTGVVFGAKLIDLPNLTMTTSTVVFGGKLFLIIPSYLSSYFCSGIDLTKLLHRFQLTLLPSPSVTSLFNTEVRGMLSYLKDFRS